MRRHRRGRVQELREERREKQHGLRVARTNQQTLQIERAARRSGRVAAIDRQYRCVTAKGLDAEPDQVGRADQLGGHEGRSRCGQQRTQAHRRQRHHHQHGGHGAGHRRHRPARAVVERVGHAHQHRGAGRCDEQRNGCDVEEVGGERHTAKYAGVESCNTDHLACRLTAISSVTFDGNEYVT